MKTYSKQEFLAEFDEIVEATIASGEPVYIVENGVVVLELSPVVDQGNEIGMKPHLSDGED